VAVYITHRHMVGGNGHEHIGSVMWQSTTDVSDTGTSTRQAMVDWIGGGGVAYVAQGGHISVVGVVDGTPPYLRSYADGVWNDNLLALPVF
jgi:hypothetical protein